MTTPPYGHAPTYTPILIAPDGKPWAESEWELVPENEVPSGNACYLKDNFWHPGRQYDNKAGDYTAHGYCAFARPKRKEATCPTT